MGMTDESERNWEDEEAELIAAGVIRPPQCEMDWDEFWKLPIPLVSDEAVKEAIAWAKGCAADRMVDHLIESDRSAEK